MDLDDLEDIVDDPEDIIEDIVDVDDFIETALSSPGTIIATLVGVLSFGVVLLGLFLTVIGFLLSLEIATFIIAGITFLSFLTMVGAFGVLLHIHTSIPSDIQSKIQEARERADEEPHAGESISEQDAIDQLKEQYASGDITQAELDRRIDEVFDADDPERVLERERR